MIITGTFGGVLFIGDPHVSSRRPGRRFDDFLSTVLGKLEEAAQIANEQDLLPVITGDLIHRAGENSIELVHRLGEVLRKFKHTPIDIEGNHGKGQTRLGVGDVETLLASFGALRLVQDPGVFAQIQLSNSDVRLELHACPYGFDLPKKLKVTDGFAGVLVSHHDLAFESAYPGAVELHEIAGCTAAVNGHMHKRAPSVQVGETLWHCPGNIEPLSIDVRDHRPAVWVMRDPRHKLQPVYLRHDPDCFSMEGRQVAAASAEDAVEALSTGDSAEKSLFVEELTAQSAGTRTEDATDFEQEVSETLEASEASEPLRQLMAVLVERVKQRGVSA